MIGLDLSLTSLAGRSGGQALASYDFVSGVFPAGCSFARASDAVFVAQDQQFATSPPDAPRLDFAPMDGGARGVLIEGGATNLVTRSNALTAWGTSGNATVTYASSIGALSLFEVKRLSGGSTPERTFSAPVDTIAAETFAVSLLVSKLDGGVSRLSLENGSRAIWALDINWPDDGDLSEAHIATGFSGGSVTLQNLTVQPVVPNVHRIAFSFLADESAGFNFRIQPNRAAADSANLFGAVQLELGNAASSHVITLSDVATRAADIAQITNLANGVYDVRVFANGQQTDLSQVAVSGPYWPAEAVGHVEAIEVYGSGELL